MRAAGGNVAAAVQAALGSAARSQVARRFALAWRRAAPALWDSGRAVLLGLVGGAVCYLLAELATPNGATSASEHDRWVTQRLGFFLAPGLALWLGWTRRSWPRAAIGALGGLATGWLGFALCSGPFQPILLGLPVLLGATSTALAAAEHEDRLRDTLRRFGRGLAVGLSIGVAYIVFLGLGAPAFWPRSGYADYTSAHVDMMWRAGPLALGLAGALLVPLLRWATAPADARAVLSGTGARGPRSEAVRRFKSASARAA